MTLVLTFYQGVLKRNIVLVDADFRDAYGRLSRAVDNKGKRPPVHLLFNLAICLLVHHRKNSGIKTHLKRGQYVVYVMMCHRIPVTRTVGRVTNLGICLES